MKPTEFPQATNFMTYERITEDNKIEKDTVKFWTDGNQYVVTMLVTPEDLIEMKKTGRLYIVGHGKQPDNIIVESKNPFFEHGKEEKTV